MDFAEEIKEFLIESNENLASLDREIVELEQHPENLELIASAFRAIHTIKGTSGFFGFDVLGSLTHVTENLLSEVRDGRQKLTPETITLLLESIDEVKRILDSIERNGEEGEDRTADLRARLGMRLGMRVGKPPAVSPSYETARVPESPVSPALEAVTGRKDQVAEVVPENDATQEAGNALVDSTIRVDVGLLNSLMNMVGELVLARNQLLQEIPSQNSSLQQTSQRLNLITSELQEGVMKTRMQPIGVVWSKLPRVVRDLASRCGKKIRLEMDGADTELDKTIIEAIKDPLTHIVRNCCDHGIEAPAERLAKAKKAEGLIQLRAFHEGGVVNIEIADDGAGIDPERVKRKAVERGLLSADQAAQMSVRDAMGLIFLPGFSTAAQVTNISGRGVGMDVVKSNIERIGGNVDVLLRPEGGTTIRIKIPLTLAIIPGLVVTLRGIGPAQVRDAVGVKEAGDCTDPSPCLCAEERFIIPQANLLELVRIEHEDQSRHIEEVHGTPIFRHRGHLLPVIYLDRILGLKGNTARSAEAVNIVVLQVEARKVALVVDRICDTQEIVVKPLGRQLRGLSCYVGATIMGDGRPALILDVVGLSRLAGLATQARPIGSEEVETLTTEVETQKLLLFRSAEYARVAVPLAMVDRLEEVNALAIEYAAGRPVLHYRGEILQLVRLQESSSARFDQLASLPPTVQVIVFNIAGRRMGLIVEQILDIVDDVVTAPSGEAASGLLGSAIVGGRITDLLDLDALLPMIAASPRRVQHAEEVCA